MNIIKQEIVYINGSQYNYVEFDKKNTDGSQYSELTYIQTEQEILQQINQNRIAELKEIITNKNYLGDDVTVERTELRALLGL